VKCPYCRGEFVEAVTVTPGEVTYMIKADDDE
jgi:hypothetical protein